MTVVSLLYTANHFFQKACMTTGACSVVNNNGAWAVNVCGDHGAENSKTVLPSGETLGKPPETRSLAPWSPTVASRLRARPGKFDEDCKDVLYMP